MGLIYYRHLSAEVVCRHGGGEQRESEMVRADFRSFQLTPSPPAHRPTSSPVSDEQDEDLELRGRGQGKMSNERKNNNG